MKKRKILNGIMVGLIVVIAACGVMAVGTIKGWFSGNKDNFAKVTKSIGIASIERKGISYSLQEGTVLAEGDALITNTDAQVKLQMGGNEFTMAEDSEITLSGIKSSSAQITLAKGELFGNVRDKSAFNSISVGNLAITVENGTFSANIQTGSAGINVFGGEISVTDGTSTKSAKAGECISIVGSQMTVSDLQIASLNDFNISQVKDINEAVEVCFTDEELDKVISDRQQEKVAAAEGDNKGNDEASSQSNGSADDSTQGSGASQGSSSSNGGLSQSSSSDSSSAQGNGSSGNAPTPGNSTDNGSSQGSSSSSNGSGQESGGESNIHKCTIKIVCDTILDNMDDLDPAKKPYVPSNGVILGTSTVEFTEGETAFDVLKRACTRANIQLEYSYTPMYGSNYIEGINNLYEFDCGEQSGWMYKVNGWFPNYGASSCKLKDGDAIVWCYTCKGLGADVGGGM